MGDNGLAVRTLAEYDIPHGGFVSPPTANNLQQQLIDLDKKHDAAHKRLREDFDDLAIAVANSQSLTTALRQDFNNFRTNPVNVSTVSFTMNQVIAVLASVLLAAGGCYAIIESVAKVSDAVERLDKKTELLRIQYESVMKAVLTQGRDK